MSELQTMPLRFRVWDSCSREWVAPYPDLRHTPYVFDIRVMLEQLGKKITWLENKRYIISQDTGLPARDGQHMFTGDIVEIADTGADGFEGDGERGVVAYEDGSAVLQNQCGEFIDYLYDFDPDALYRIGNIWENPELLKELNG